MKVLVQCWTSAGDGEIVSLSKDRSQLRRTVKAIAPKPDPECGGEILNYENAATPDGEPMEIDIPDTSVFAEMVETRGTVFLHDDELGMVWDNLDDDD